MKISTSEASALARRYPVSVRWSDEDQAFVGCVVGLVGECCHGETAEGVVAQLGKIAEDLVTYLVERGETLPLPPTAFASGSNS
jgi:predicted RNase H-like HicB family nuclease